MSAAAEGHDPRPSPATPLAPVPWRGGRMIGLDADAPALRRAGREIAALEAAAR
jgi:hypothetical protein